MAEANVLHNTVNKSIDVLLQIQDIKSAKMKQRLTRKKKVEEKACPDLRRNIPVGVQYGIS